MLNVSCFFPSQKSWSLKRNSQYCVCEMKNLNLLLLVNTNYKTLKKDVWSTSNIHQRRLEFRAHTVLLDLPGISFRFFAQLLFPGQGLFVVYLFWFSRYIYFLLLFLRCINRIYLLLLFFEPITRYERIVKQVSANQNTHTTGNKKRRHRQSY